MSRLTPDVWSHERFADYPAWEPELFVALSRFVCSGVLGKHHGNCFPGDHVSEPNDPDRHRAVASRVIAKRTIVIRSPAFDPSHRRKGTGVVHASRDRLNTRSKPSNLHRLRAVRNGVVAKLAGLVRPPALDRARPRKRADVRLTYRNRLNGCGQP
jgi:hypothetical protein